MRMWMVEPGIMCNQHLLGEHVELHMIVGHLNKEKSVKGYVETNCIEVLSIKDRHDVLVKEMEQRGMNHKSPLPDFYTAHLTDEELFFKIDRESSLKSLLDRCEGCKNRGDRMNKEKLKEIEVMKKLIMEKIENFITEVDSFMYEETGERMPEENKEELRTDLEELISIYVGASRAIVQVRLKEHNKEVIG